MQRKLKTLRKGFTLIELLVVILILAILAALIVPRLIGRTDDAKISKAKSDVATLESLVSQFRLDTGSYPSTESGLNALRVQPSDVEGWKGPYLTKDLPLDPWNHAYVYEYPGRNGADFTVGSYGADGVEGGDGSNADIFNEAN